MQPGPGKSAAARIGLSALRADLRIALIYAVFGWSWILFSDVLLAVVVTDPAALTRLQTYKGWAFVAISALAIHLLLRRELVLRTATEEKNFSLAKFPAENPGPVFRISQAGEILYSNPAGYPLLREWGCTVGEPVPAFWQERLSEVFAARESRTIDVTHGDDVFSFFIAYVPEAPYVNLFGRNITDRMRAEERFRIVVESAPDAILLMDRGGKIVMVNSQMEKFFGYNRSELVGSDVDRLVPERFQVHHTAHREGFLADPQTRPMGARRELYGVRKDGSEFPVEIGLTSIQPRDGLLVMATIVDITDRKQAEKQLENQNRRLKALREIDTAILAADSMEVIVGAALSHILELIECRRASLALIDWKTSEALMFDVKEEGETFLPEGTRVPFAVPDDMLPILAKNQPVLINDLTALPDPPPYFAADMKEGFRSVCILPLISQNDLIGIFNLYSDRTGFFDDEMINLGREVADQLAIAITQNRLFAELHAWNADLEQRVTARTLQLESANRELESFSYSVSHDLRAPLRAINGFSLALSTRHADSLGEQGIHYLNRIVENTRHMGELIDDLLTLSRITRREMEAGDVNLSALAQEIADELRTLDPERQVVFEIEDHVEGRGDAGLIRVVLDNLIGNAWKFTIARAQTKIRFGVTSSLEAGEGKIGEGETVYFVQDNGVGFDMAYADKLFGAFQRLHSMAEFPGTGIGLATVQRIIHRHGGRIWAKAGLDQGAAFYFTLGGGHEKQ